jgi:TRAP-type mannitol/chloroaromatic compound transport system permease small subunit
VPKTFIQSAIWVGFGLMALQSVAEIIKIWAGLEPEKAAGMMGH